MLTAFAPPPRGYSLRSHFLDQVLQRDYCQRELRHCGPIWRKLSLLMITARAAAIEGKGAGQSVAVLSLQAESH